MTILLWSIPAAPLAAAAIIAALGRAAGPAGWLATGAAAYAVAAGIAVTGSGARSSIVWFEAERLVFTVGLRADGIAASFALLVAAVSAVVNLYAIGYMREKEAPARFFAWMALFEASMLSLVLADSLLLLFAGWEGVGVASWALIAHDHDRAEARRAGAQAFLVTRLGDLAMLGAWLAAVLAVGSTDLSALLSAASTGRLTEALASALALLFLVAALAKSAQLPFSAWLPDAMIGPTPVSALLHSATMVAAGAFLVIRLWPLFELAPGALTLLRWVGLTTVAAAALAATVQDDLKGVLAWSTVDQLGLMMLTLGLAGPGPAALLLFTHALFKAGLFLAAGMVDEATGTRALSRLGGLGRSLPAAAVTFGACALALAAFPPFAGFVSGDEVLASAVRAGSAWAAAVIALVLLAGVYAGRAFAGAFLSWPRSPVPRARALPRTMRAGGLLLAVGSSVAGWALSRGLAVTLPFGRTEALGAGWRVAAIAASAAGLALGTGLTALRGPRPLLGGWVHAAPEAARALASAQPGPLFVYTAVVAAFVVVAVMAAALAAALSASAWVAGG